MINPILIPGEYFLRKRHLHFMGMKKYHLKSLLIVFLFVFLPNAIIVSAAPLKEPDALNAWQPVVSGIDFQVFHFNNPKSVNVFVTRLDRNNTNVTIESSIAQGRIASGRESITGMAGRYEQAINYWGQVWGGRNKVVAAVNGYYFDGATGTPWSGVVHSGWYAKRFTDVVGDAGFAWTLNRNAFIGSCISHNNSKNSITFVTADYSTNIRGINMPAGSEDLIVYTPQYDSNTRTASTTPLPRVEILVEMTRPTLILPPPNSTRGYIRQIRRSGFSSQIPFDHVVISAWGAVGDTIVGRIDGGSIAIGDEIRISQEISNCNSAPQFDWTKTYASIGGDYHYLSDGVIRTDFSNPDASVRNSRTAVAYNDSYVFFIVVDAFDPGVSEGLNIAQLADFTKNTLGAMWAVTLDSGTSSTMVVDHQVVNNTYCNFTRNCGTLLNEESPYLQDQAVLPLEITYGTEWTDASGVIEPLVGTGLMMVVVEPKQQSVSHHVDEIVMTISPTELRLGPGTNYATSANISALTAGTVLDALPGILAKGSYWWKVDFNGQVGWIKEEALLGGSSGPNDLRIFLPGIYR